MRRTWIASIALMGLLMASGCAPERVVTTPEPSPAPSATPTATPSPATPTVTPPAPTQASSIAWLDTPLTDAVTGKEFKLSDFKGKPVLLHAFAAW